MMKTPRRTVPLFVFAAATVLALSCNDDSTTSNPPPSCPITSPEKAFGCMQQALASQKAADYESSISTNFVFSPTPEDSLNAAFAGVPVYDAWNKDVEMQALGVLFDGTKVTHVDWGTPSRLISKATFVRWNVSYALKAVFVAAPHDTVTSKEWRT